MPEDTRSKEVTIHIDKTNYRVPAGEQSGAQIRQIPTPPIGEDFDLWLEVPGGQDTLVADNDHIELKDGMHFFTVQRRISPGR